MNTTASDTFEDAIAGAGPADEARLFGEALSLFRADMSIVRYCETNAFADAAIHLHRVLLPSCGYQFGETAVGRGLASTWKAGDAYALPFEASTPGLALLRATTHAMARHLATERRAGCMQCGGRGWVVARDGRKHICSHNPLPRFR